MNPTKKLGLVTVLYNTPEVLDDFYLSLSLQKYKNFILYVVDNSSNSESIQKAQLLAKEFNIDCVFIDNHGDNVGVAAANNQGIHAALAAGVEAVILINNDLLFKQENVICSVMSSLSDGEDLVSPLILSYPEEKIWYAGGQFDELRGIAPHINAGIDLDKPLQYMKNYSYAPTCFLAISVKVFDIVGFMDSEYFVYYDDTDFLYRAHSKGFSVFLNSDAIIYHKVSSSTGGGVSSFGIYYLTRNRLLFIMKNFKFPYLQISFLYTIISRFFRALVSEKKIRHAFFKGIFDAFKLMCK
ncbi:glycosyltransferase family 2 protein [Shewanella baltica]|uniref:glycosyltransferase family 2 protein n=1 Tax=Shewanella baltica TaxID=62322 RepID=UPI002169F98B|nr:glycosyltransferase family 2 protein [Shewanella baltica]MCS6113303.1 glycosyltransferase family 2 protein [Shewanella baltica]UVW64708.1 glycosyltransferase family 2 protein [Shewanella baltica]